MIIPLKFNQNITEIFKVGKLPFVTSNSLGFYNLLLFSKLQVQQYYYDC